MTLRRDKFGNPVFDFRTNLELGDIPDSTFIEKFGFNKDIETITNINSFEVVASFGGKFQPSSASELLRIQASGVDSGSNILIIGVNSAHRTTVETVTLTVSGFSQSTVPFREVNRSVLLNSPSGTRQNNANITGVGSATGKNYFQIPQFYSTTQQTVYTLSESSVGYLDDYAVSATKNSGGQNPILDYNIVYFDSTLGVQYRYFEDPLDTAVVNYKNQDIPFTGPFRPKSTVWMEAGSDRDNTRVYGRLYIKLLNSM